MMSSVNQSNNQDAVISALQKSAEVMPLCAPPEEVWCRIQQTITKTEPKTTFKSWMVNVALVSFVTAALSLFSWQNYALKQELALMIELNASLEEVFLEQEKVQFIYASNIVELLEIDSKLSRENSIQEKISLLKKRKQLIESMTVAEEKEIKYAI